MSTRIDTDAEDIDTHRQQRSSFPWFLWTDTGFRFTVNLCVVAASTLVKKANTQNSDPELEDLDEKETRTVVRFVPPLVPPLVPPIRSLVTDFSRHRHDRAQKRIQRKPKHVKQSHDEW